MDFFAEQDQARKRSKWLVVLFCLAVISIALSVFFVLSYVYQPSWELFWITGVGTIGVVSLASLGRIASLASGGSVVAEALGGQLISPNTSDPPQRRILNIVEEMAIASGTPVPPVYLMEEKSINAFAAGYSPNDAVVGITRGCVEKLNREQLQGVVAHEFSHILNGDMRLNIKLTGLIFGIVCLSRIGEVLMRVAALSGSGRRRKKDDGTMAILPYGEIKMEIRRFPRGMYKVLELAANKAYETNHYNIMGCGLNPVIPFTPQPVALKKIREFFTKNPIIKTFIAGMDKKDERVFLSDIKGQ